MSLSNTSSRYGSLAKSFHWATVVLIFSAFPVGYFANELAHQINSAGFDGDAGVIRRATFLFSLHKTLGVTALFTAILRILWAITQQKPGLLHPDNKPEALAAEVVHWLLYALMVLVPLSGWVMHASEVGYAPIWWPFGQGLPFVPKSDTLAGLAGGFHWLMVWSLFTVVGLHVAGALKHHVIDRDMTLRRMLPFGGTAPQPPEQKHMKLPAPVAALVLIAVVLGAAQLGVLQGHDHSSHDHTGHDHAEQAEQDQAEQENAAHDHSAHDHGAHDHDSHDHGAEDAAETSATKTNAWVVDTGSLGIEAVQMGSAVQGSFANWDAAISFTNPDAPGPAGSVVVDVEIASLSLGSVTTQALGTDFFNVAQFPSARFEADLIKLEDGYEARGTLTIRDQTQPFTLPFALEIDGNTAKMVGTSSVQRLDYNVGLSQPDESTVGFGVGITVELTAHQPGS